MLQCLSDLDVGAGVEVELGDLEGVQELVDAQLHVQVLDLHGGLAQRAHGRAARVVVGEDAEGLQAEEHGRHVLEGEEGDEVPQEAQSQPFQP